jgi:hypothetical protein
MGIGTSRALGCVTICGSHLKDRIAPFQMPEDRSTFLGALHGLIEFAEIGGGNLPFAARIEVGVAGVANTST